MFFQSRCNTFVTFVYFYIRLFGKKLEKSCLTERLKCEQKWAKKWLCAICIVEVLEGYGRISEGYKGRFRAICLLPRQNIENLLPESASWRKIIHRNTGSHSGVVQRQPRRQAAPRLHDLPGITPPWRKKAPIIYRSNSDCDHSRRN